MGGHFYSVYYYIAATAPSVVSVLIQQAPLRWLQELALSQRVAVEAYGADFKSFSAGVPLSPQGSFFLRPSCYEPGDRTHGETVVQAAFCSFLVLSTKVCFHVPAAEMPANKGSSSDEGHFLCSALRSQAADTLPGESPV